MTQTPLFEQRKKSLEQRKNRLKQLEASLNMLERKRRTKRLIEIGGLAAKAHLDTWNTNTLLGGLLFLKTHESDPRQMEEWTHTGGTAFASGKESSSHNKDPKNRPSS
jgi:hypothetical protein